MFTFKEIILYTGKPRIDPSLIPIDILYYSFYPGELKTPQVSKRTICKKNLLYINSYEKLTRNIIEVLI